MKRFVVREGVGLRPSFSFEFTAFDAQREKSPCRGKIIYQVEVAEALDLSEAIRLYQSGVRLKVKDAPREPLPPLAELLAQKREKRARALRELTDKVA